MTVFFDGTDDWLHGFVEDGFVAIADEFRRNFTARGDVGAAFCAIHKGRTIADLWGGEAAPGRPWREDTLQVVFSGTKGLTAACMLMLIDRGQLDLAAPVARYWPEFGAQGKSGVLVRDVVSHRAGLPGVTSAKLTADDLIDAERMESLLAAEPLPADANAYRCYHALSIGWLCGGILRRIDGRSIGRFFAEEIAAPLSLDIWIGLPPAQEPRVGQMQFSSEFGPWDDGLTPEQAADPVRKSIWGNPPLFPTDGLPWNTREFRASEIAAAGAIATARSMARFYACLSLGGELEGVRLMKPQTLEEGRRELSRFVDPFLIEPMAIGTVFGLQAEQMRFGPPLDAFGHQGAGGSIHGAWPEQRIGFSYLMNQMRADPQDLRVRPILQALYIALD